jgi:hypothetical protein
MPGETNRAIAEARRDHAAALQIGRRFMSRYERTLKALAKQDLQDRRG